MRLGTFYRELLWQKLDIQTKQNYKVLDVGCFDGYRLSTQNAKEKYAVDIDIAEKYSNIIYQKTDGTTLGFLDNSFDMIVSFEVIEHIDAGKEAQYLSEMIRVLKPGKTLFMSTPSHDIKVFPTFLTNWISKRRGHFKQNGYYPTEINEFLGDRDDIKVEYTQLKCRGYLDRYFLHRFLWIICKPISKLLIKKAVNFDYSREGKEGYLIIKITKK